MVPGIAGNEGMDQETKRLEKSREKKRRQVAALSCKFMLLNFRESNCLNKTLALVEQEKQGNLRRLDEDVRDVRQFHKALLDTTSQDSGTRHTAERKITEALSRQRAISEKYANLIKAWDPCDKNRNREQKMENGHRIGGSSEDDPKVCVGTAKLTCSEKVEDIFLPKLGSNLNVTTSPRNRSCSPVSPTLRISKNSDLFVEHVAVLRQRSAARLHLSRETNQLLHEEPITARRGPRAHSVSGISMATMRTETRRCRGQTDSLFRTIEARTPIRELEEVTCQGSVCSDTKTEVIIGNVETSDRGDISKDAIDTSSEISRGRNLFKGKKRWKAIVRNKMMPGKRKNFSRSAPKINVQNPDLLLEKGCTLDAKSCTANVLKPPPGWTGFKQGNTSSRVTLNTERIMRMHSNDYNAERSTAGARVHVKGKRRFSVDLVCSAIAPLGTTLLKANAKLSLRRRRGSFDPQQEPS